MNQVAFVHIPKTGGTYAMAKLSLLPSENPLAWHYTVNDAIHPRKKNVQIKESFSIVRNPWGRLVSVYFYCMKKHYADNIICGRSRFKKFGDWVESLRDEYGDSPPPKNQENESDYFWLAPQYDWLFSESDKQVVNHIGKLENHNEYFLYLKTKIAVNINYSQEVIKNQTKHGHYSNYYCTKSLVDFVRNWYEKDICTFGYEFEHNKIWL